MASVCLCQEGARLELNLSFGYKFDSASLKPYTFPNVSLGLISEGSSGGCSRAYFKSLKSLTLNRVDVSEEVLQFILHNFLSLEYLVVRRCYNLISLEVSAPSPALKRLEIYYCTDLERLTIFDANLVSLKTDAKVLVLRMSKCLLIYIFMVGTPTNVGLLLPSFPVAYQIWRFLLSIFSLRGYPG